MPSLRSSQGRSAVTAAGGGAGGAGVATGAGDGAGEEPVNHQTAPPTATSNSKPIPANKGAREAPSCLMGGATSSRGGGAGAGAGAGGAGAIGVIVVTRQVEKKSNDIVRFIICCFQTGQNFGIFRHKK